MKLFLFSTAAPEGGHFRSMVTIGSALQRRGHAVYIVSARGPGLRLATQAGIETLLLPSPCLKSIEFNWRDFGTLRNLMRVHRPDVAHSFENGIPALILAARGLGVSVTATLCGGRPRRIMPRVAPLIVFSEELRSNMIDLGIPPAEIHVIAGRMELRVPVRDPEVDAYLQTLGLTSADGPFVFMICRTDVPKQRALHHFFAAAARYAARGTAGTFVHIGQGKNEAFVTAMRQLAESVNARAGRTVLVSTAEGAGAPVKYLHLADVVVGMGRSAFEGMLLGTTTLILSNEGYGGPVAPGLVERLASHNFTARGVPRGDSAEVLGSFVSDLEDLLKDADRRILLGRFAADWCRDNLDVNEAAKRYEEVYAQLLAGPPAPLHPPDLIRNIGYETLRALGYGLRQRISRATHTAPTSL